MSRFSAAAAFVLACLSFDSSAFTLEPLPGTTPQSTCFSCVFPNEIGVIARDGLGQPMANVSVRFEAVTNSLGMVRYDDFCCVAHDDITVVTGPDGIARATAITIHQASRTGQVRAWAPGIQAFAYFTLSSTAQRATQVEIVNPHRRFVQVGTDFESPWMARALDANGQPVPLTMLTFYVGNLGGEQATASFNGGDEWAFAVADANGVAVSPIAHSETIGTGEGWVIASTKAPVEGESVPWAGEQYVPVDYAITSRSATIVGTPPDSVQLNSVAAAPYPVRVLDAAGAPAVGMPVYFMTDGQYADERCMSFFAQGSGDEVIYTDANGIATPSVLYGDIPGSCPLKVWIGGVADPIAREVWVFDPANVVAKPRHEWVTSDTGHKYRVTLDFTENGRKVQPGAIEWIEVKRYVPGLPAGITGGPKYTFANNSAIIELRANQFPGVYDLDIAYTATNHARVHVLQLP